MLYNEQRHSLPVEFRKALSGFDPTNLMKKYMGLRGSPIEADLLAWLFVQPKYKILSWPESQKLRRATSQEFDGLIIPQGKVGSYRVDFLVVAGTEKGMRLFAVECDGHDFHQKTKTQVTQDKIRERYLVGRGCIVLRYTGSEIFKDPSSTALSLLRTIDSFVENHDGE